MSVETLETGFLGVRETLSGLEADGKLVKGTAVAAEVKKISERMETARGKQAKREMALATAIEGSSDRKDRPGC